ncbi:MAG TPA: N-acetylmuramoyl-L-alanine amidase [Mycobacteriales bacterium]|nr:N-acetylmuramoyl-L-alanine amidase [Mycobacteriales bacterium]
MQLIRRGDRGPAAAEVRSTLVVLGLLEAGAVADDAVFDGACELALREFQQGRGLTADGVVGAETWRALVAARWRLGDRVLTWSVTDPLVGDDVHTLQERLLEMGYDVGRADGVFGSRTSAALSAFQREVGVPADGTFGPTTMRALRQLGRRVVGGSPQLLRETLLLHHTGPALVGKRIVIDPGHGGTDRGVVVADGMLQWSESDLVYDLAARLEGRLSALGVRADLTRGRDTGAADRDRAAFANASGADLLVSLHLDGHRNPQASGVATYFYGTGSGVSSSVGERLAHLVQREVVVRTGMLDGRTHYKTWELLRLTRMPAVRVEAGYLTSPVDRARLVDPSFRDAIAEAILVAVQRVFLPTDADVATGSLKMSALRAGLPQL